MADLENECLYDKEINYLESQVVKQILFEDEVESKFVEGDTYLVLQFFNNLFNDFTTIDKDELQKIGLHENLMTKIKDSLTYRDEEWGTKKKKIQRYWKRIDE